MPTLTVMDRILVHGEQAGIPGYILENVRQRTERHHQAVKEAYDMGVNIGCGTDAGSMLTPHGSAGREIVQLVRCGLTPMQANEIATRNTARLLKMDDVGTLEEGKLADVIIVEGDVADDVRRLEVAGNMRNVFVGGRAAAAGGSALRH